MTAISGTNISWTSELDRTYTLQYSTDQVSNVFTTVESDIATTVPVNTFPYESDIDVVFFRVIVE